MLLLSCSRVWAADDARVLDALSSRVTSAVDLDPVAGDDIGIESSGLGGLLSSSHLAELETDRRGHLARSSEANRGLLVFCGKVEAALYWHFRHVDRT
jgi:hypothetical protein